jgi:hypothetical protein
MAACVSATIVNAAATAVDCMSAALMVGSAGAAGLHAPMIMAKAKINDLMVKLFI